MNCKSHAKEITIYDETENLLLCIDCLLLSPRHRSNNILNLEAACKKLKIKYNQDVRVLNENRKQLETIKGEQIRAFNLFNRSKMNVSKALEEIRKSIMNQVNDLFLELKNEMMAKQDIIEGDFNQKQELLNTAIEKQTFVVNQISNCINGDGYSILRLGTNPSYNKDIQSLILDKINVNEESFIKNCRSLCFETNRSLSTKLGKFKNFLVSKKLPQNMGLMRPSKSFTGNINYNSQPVLQRMNTDVFKKQKENPQYQIEISNISEFHTLKSNNMFVAPSQEIEVAKKDTLEFQNQISCESQFFISSMNSNVLRTDDNIGNTEFIEESPSNAYGEDYAQSKENKNTIRKLVQQTSITEDTMQTETILLSPVRKGRVLDEINQNSIKNSKMKKRTMSFVSSNNKEKSVNKWKSKNSVKNSFVRKRTGFSQSFNISRTGEDRRIVIVGGSKANDLNIRFFNTLNMTLCYQHKIKELKDIVQGYSLYYKNRIWIMGGKTKERVFDTVFSYNPSNKTIKPRFKLNRPKYGFTAVALGEDKFLLIGGKSFNGEKLNEIELLDMKTRKTKVVGRLDYGLSGHYAFKVNQYYMNNIVFKNGETANTDYIAIIGGKDSKGNILNTLSFLHLDSFKIQKQFKMAYKRKDCSALLYNNKIFVFGGKNNKPLKSIECFDNNTFNQIAELQKARYGFMTIQMNQEDKLLMIGGKGSNRTSMAISEIFDFKNNNSFLSHEEFDKERLAFATIVQIP